MNLDSIIEISIGLIVTWLILSMATMQLQELITDLLGWRSSFLEQRLFEMFKNKGLKDQFYKHPFIQALKVKTWWWNNKAIDIPANVFAKAAVDIFMNAGKTEKEIPAGTMNWDEMRNNLKTSMSTMEKMEEPIAHVVKFLIPNLNLNKETKKAGKNIEQASKDAEKALGDFRGNVETWFDSTMVQATAMYRKNAQIIAFFIGFALAVIFNVDSIYIVKQLWFQPTLRASIVAQAQNIKPDDTTSNDAINKLAQNNLSLPVGWDPQNGRPFPTDIGGWLLKSLGFFFSGAAASLGAPFWFDILKKLLGLKTEPEPKRTEREKV